MSLNEMPSNSVSGRPRRVFEAELIAKWSSEGQLEGPIFLQLAWFLTNLIIEGIDRRWFINAHRSRHV